MISVSEKVNDRVEHYIIFIILEIIMTSVINYLTIDLTCTSLLIDLNVCGIETVSVKTENNSRIVEHAWEQTSISITDLVIDTDNNKIHK